MATKEHHRKKRIKFVTHLLASWLIMTAALLIMAAILPGLAFTTLGAAFLSTAVIGLINALIWPLVMYYALPIAILSLGLFVLLMNGLILTLASDIIPGLTVDNIWSGILAATGIASISGLLSSWLGVDEDYSYYRNVIRRHARKVSKFEPTDVPGVLFLEIDGLGEPILKNALEKGYMPTLEKWLDSGSHQLVSWEPDWSSQTGASQAGILHGDNTDVPAFRWYDRSEKEIQVCNRPAIAAKIEQDRSNGDGLLADQGVSRFNLFSGDAPRVMFTSSSTNDLSRIREKTTYAYFANPYNFARTFTLFFWDIILEKKAAWSQRLRDEKPRVHRGGIYPLVRATSTVIMRDLNVYTLIGDMYEGVPAAYATFFAYDEVAHHSGIERRDALDILHKLDQQFARLEHAAELAPRPYHLVVLSDHGQSQGATFLQRYGLTLDELVRSLIAEEHRVDGIIATAEGWDNINVLLSEAIQDDSQLSSRVVRRIVSTKTKDGQVALGPEHKLESKIKKDDSLIEPNVIVLASGNLGLIYFADFSERLTLEQIDQLHPSLISRLVQHEGIGFLMVASEENGPMAVGAEGVYYLKDDRIEGKNPLEPFGTHAADHLRRSNQFSNVADIMINGFYDSETNEGAAFEELVGFHGGLGGWQMQPFILFPSEFSKPEVPIVGTTDVHRVLKGWVNTLVDPTSDSELKAGEGTPK